MDGKGIWGGQAQQVEVQEGWGTSIGTVGADPLRPCVEVTCSSRKWSQVRHQARQPAQEWPVGMQWVTGNFCSQMSAVVTSQALACGKAVILLMALSVCK